MHHRHRHHQHRDVNIDCPGLRRWNFSTFNVCFSENIILLRKYPQQSLAQDSPMLKFLTLVGRSQVLFISLISTWKPSIRRNISAWGSWEFHVNLGRGYLGFSFKEWLRNIITAGGTTFIEDGKTFLGKTNKSLLESWNWSLISFHVLFHLDEKIKTVWVNFNWLDMRSARLGSLCQHENFLQFAVNVLRYAGVGPEDCVMLHWYH